MTRRATGPLAQVRGDRRLTRRLDGRADGGAFPAACQAIGRHRGAVHRERRIERTLQARALRVRPLFEAGTPAGVALGIEGNPYLRSGDVVELIIDGLGVARQNVGQA